MRFVKIACVGVFRAGLSRMVKSTICVDLGTAIGQAFAYSPFNYDGNITGMLVNCAQ
jgi:hypothetical protein